MNQIIENNEIIETNENEEPRIWKVYLHTIPKEISGYDWDKYYVGITHNPTKIRWGLFGQGYKGQIFYNAIEKYGWNNIKHEVLIENLTENEACNCESKLIEKLNSCDSRYGYNANYGGNIGGVLPLRISQYSLDGEYIKIHKNRKIAQEEIGGVISVGEGINSHGFQWLWLKNGETPPEKISKYIDTSLVKLAKYDLDGNFICIHDGIVDAEKTLNIIKFSPDYKSSHGYQWVRLNPNEVPPKKIEKYVLSVRKPVEKYDLHGNFVCEYESETSASLEHPTINISISCGIDRITADGFQWKFKGSDKEIKKLSKNPNYNTIYLYNKDGYYIGEFENKRQALIFIGNNGNSKIDDIIFELDYYNYKYGYRWSLNKVDKLPDLIEIDSRYCPIVKICKETNTILDIFTSASNAEKYLKSINKRGTASSIISCCRGNLKTSSGYIWKYIDDIQESQICDSFLLEKFKKINNILNLFRRKNK